MKAKMSDPRIYMFRMIAILAVVGLIVAFLYQPIAHAFAGNFVLNSIILATAFIGILFIFRQIWRLVPETKWLSDISPVKKTTPSATSPVLLATVATMLSQSGEERHLSALSSRSVLDSVAARLDEGREISRYFIGLLIFLGLLGTFWGLLQTIASVSEIVNNLDVTNSDFGAVISQLRIGLDAPLAGMATAFSSSLFGLSGSLGLGCLDLQLGQAMGRFFNEVEDWLSSFVHYRDGNMAVLSDSHQALAQGLSAEGARALTHLATSIDHADKDRAEQLQQIIKMNSHLSLLNEKIADEQRLRDFIGELGTRIEQLNQTFAAQSERQNKAMTTELRALSTAIIKLTDKK